MWSKTSEDAWPSALLARVVILGHGLAPCRGSALFPHVTSSPEMLLPVCSSLPLRGAFFPAARCVSFVQCEARLSEAELIWHHIVGLLILSWAASPAVA